MKKSWWCKLNLHKWNIIERKCEDCGKIDDLLYEVHDSSEATARKFGVTEERQQ